MDILFRDSASSGGKLKMVERSLVDAYSSASSGTVDQFEQVHRMYAYSG